MRQTGIELVGAVPWGTHFCQFYQDGQDLVDILVPYFKAGLESNEFCIWVTSDPLGAEAAESALARGIADFNGRARRGQIEILDYSQWYTIGGRFDADRVLQGWVEKLETAKRQGCEGLRLSGNTFWLEDSDWQDFTQYEAAVDRVIQRYPMLALCTYSLSKCGATEILDVISNHAFALIKRSGTWLVIKSAERKRMEASLRESEARSSRIIETQAARLRQASSHQELLAVVVSRLLASEDPQAIVNDLAHKVMDELECHVFFNFLADPAHGRLNLNAYGGVDEQAVQAIEHLEYGSSVCGCVARDGCRFVAENIAESPDPLTELVRSFGVTAYACHPLVAGGTVIGTLSFGSRTRTHFSDADLTLMQVVTDHIAIAMERVRAQRALRDSERLYRAIGESIDFGIWICDPEGRNTYASESFLRLVGLTQEQCSRFGWGNVLHPEDAERTIAAWKECVRTTGTWDIEHRYHGVDGQYHPILARGVPVRDENGQVICWAGINLDISRLKEAEARIRHQNRILEGLNRIFGEALSHNTEEELARTWLAVAESVTESKFGFVAEINTQGRLDHIAMTDPGWDACRTQRAAGQRKLPVSLPIHGIYGRVLSNGKGFYTNDPASHPDSAGFPPGHPFLTCFLGVPLIHGGKTMGMIGLGNREGGYRPEDLYAAETLAVGIAEVFARTRAERAARAVEERFHQAQKMESIGLLAGGIAHDFNNLLVGVIGNASLAEDLLPHGSPVHEVLHRIIKAGEQAANLTRQMLAYAGKGRFVIGPVNISSVAAESSDLLQGSIPRRITLNLNLDPDLPAVEADPSQMQQIITNLVLNAGEAIGSASGIITVNTGVVEIDSPCIEENFYGWPVEPGRFVLLEVHDTGCGMDEPTKAKIFDPFFTTKFHGRGLGLAAVAGIVRAHHGAVQVTTAVDAGTTFRVLLPAMASSAPVGAPGAAEQVSLRGQGTVLVVDDEDTVREVAKNGLERRGYEVVTAENGAAAIDIVRAQGDRIRIAVLDLSMPGMGGEETLRHLRELRPDLDVIVSSGFSEAETLRAFNGAEVSGFLQKPYTVQQLARQVKSALSDPKLLARRASSE